jgi:hypothetical protein
MFQFYPSKGKKGQSQDWWVDRKGIKEGHPRGKENFKIKIEFHDTATLLSISTKAS